MSLRTWLGRVIGLQDAQFWAEYVATRNAAQKPVNEDTALTISTVWACINLLTESIGCLPIMLYRKMPDGGREVATDHPVYALMHDRPNPDLTSTEFLSMLGACLVMNGNGYGLKRRIRDRVVGIDLIDPRVVQVTRAATTWELRYRFTYQDQAYDLGSDDLIHWRAFSAFGLDTGLSAIRYGTNTLGIAMAGDDTAGKMFANGAHQSGFIQSPVVLQKDQREQFQKSLKEFRESDSAGKMMLLEGGFTFNGLSMNFDDMQMLGSRAFSVEEICRIFRVPPFLVGHTEKVTSWGAGLEQILIGFLTFSLMPYLKRIQDRATLALLTPAERTAGYYVEFNFEGLLRADSAARAAFYSTLAQNGVLTRNEIRAKENLPKKDGGDDLTVQSALVPLAKLGQAPAASPVDAAVAQHVEDAFRRFAASPEFKAMQGGPHVDS